MARHQLLPSLTAIIERDDMMLQKGSFGTIEFLVCSSLWRRSDSNM